MDGLAFILGRISVVGDLGCLVVLVQDMWKESAKAVHAWHGHDQGGDAVQISSGTLSLINHVIVMLQVVGHGVSANVSALAEMVELDLCLIIGDRGILSDP